MRLRTKVVQEAPNRFQARYYDPEIRVWFDIGDPRDTEAAARERAREWEAWKARQAEQPPEGAE